MYRLYRKMTLNGNFSIKAMQFCLDTTVLGSIFKPSSVGNRILISGLIMRFLCIFLVSPRKPMLLILIRKAAVRRFHIICFMEK